MIRYPRTRHLCGSRKQKGDEDLEAVNLATVWNEVRSRNGRLVIEEKIDGANSGISFSSDCQLQLQSRGHYLTGGPREKHFALLKQWVACHEEALFCILGTRYVMYGEWMFAKHTVFYDALPHYFMEFDILDTDAGKFLSTPTRRKLIADAGASGLVHSVEVLTEVVDPVGINDLGALIGPSRFKTAEWQKSLNFAATFAGVQTYDAVRHTDPSLEMEGLYIKLEDDETTHNRFKFVRETFTNSILDQDEHWIDRPIIKNGLVPGAFDRMFVQEQ